MDYKRKLRKNQIILLVVTASALVGCGMLIGFGNVLKSILFVLPCFLLLPIGGYYVVMNFEGRKQFLIFASWLGFISFVTSVIGMLIEPRTYPLKWGYIFAVAGIVWIVTFVFVVVMTPVYAMFFRFWRKH